MHPRPSILQKLIMGKLHLLCIERDCRGQCSLARYAQQAEQGTAINTCLGEEAMLGTKPLFWDHQHKCG